MSNQTSFENIQLISVPCAESNRYNDVAVRYPGIDRRVVAGMALREMVGECNRVCPPENSELCPLRALAAEYAGRLCSGESTPLDSRIVGLAE